MTTTPFPVILDSVSSLSREELERLRSKVDSCLLTADSSRLHDLWNAVTEVFASRGLAVKRIKGGHYKGVVGAYKEFESMFRTMKPRPKDRRQRIMIYRLGIEQAIRRIDGKGSLSTNNILEHLSMSGGVASVLDDAFPGYAPSLLQHLNREATP